MPCLEARFWSKVNKHGPLMPGMSTRCWEWTASTRRDGYGQLNAGGKRGKILAAHRLSWFLKHGRWPHPCALHKCDYRRCVRPDHLFEGTKANNLADMASKGRSARGKSKPNTKLTIGKVLAIRHKYKTGGYTQSQLAGSYGIDPSSISRIVAGKNWSYLPC